MPFSTSFQSPPFLRDAMMNKDLILLGVTFGFSSNISLTFLVGFSGLEITGHVCFPQ